jgi:hypothetical protein
MQDAMCTQKKHASNVINKLYTSLLRPNLPLGIKNDFEFVQLKKADIK